MTQKLSYIDILVYICTQHKEFKIRHREYSNGDLAADLGFTIDKRHSNSANYMSPGQLSKVLLGKQKSWKIEQALQGAERIRNVEISLDLPGMFACSTYEQLDKIIELKIGRDRGVAAGGASEISDGSVFRSERLSPFNLIYLNQAKPDEPLFSDGERGTVRRLAQGITKSIDGVFHWGADPWSGASFVAYNLRYSANIQSHFSYMCLIRPTQFDDPYRDQLTSLAEKLGEGGERSVSPRDLVRTLRAKRVLLILCDACYIPHREAYADTRYVRRFIADAIATHSPGLPACVLTIGRSQVMRDLTRSHSEGDRLNDPLKVQPRMRFDLFKKLFTFFRNARGTVRVEEGGARLKRGMWHYGAINEQYNGAVWPANIRLRAFFASNFNNYSYFDPTMGFCALCGDEIRIPLSIQMFHDDLVAYMKRSARGKHTTELRSLRFCSTAKHWLTDDALEILRKPYKDRNSSDLRVSELTKDAFRSQLSDSLSPIVSPHFTMDAPDSGKNTGHVYTLSLGIRAIVQEEWRKNEPYDRAVAHWRVAWNLWKNQDDKEILKREFPYLPHWGRSRILLLGECMRHLVRSCDSVENRTVGQRYSDDLAFPDPPNPELGGCDPWQVINFCFSRVFQREINGNRRFTVSSVFEQTGRSLTKRHGAFEFAAELLQLLSEGLCLGRPHWALDESFVVPYYRECAFVLLDLGELHSAERYFQILCDLHVLCDRHGNMSKLYIEDMLNLALVKSEMLDLDAARQLLDVATNAAKSRDLDRGFSSVQKRILAREVHLSCLNGAYDQAVKITDSIIKKDRDLKRWDPELLQNRILALSNCDRDGENVMGECLAAIFGSSSEGFQHEVLGYRILLGRLFRLRGDLAVAGLALDDVQRDILLYGCSERTYLTFLSEAGQTLQAEGKCIRAYASYFRPCVLRSKSRSFGRFAKLAGEQALKCLSRVLNEFRGSDSNCWSESIDKFKADEARHVERDRPRNDGFFEVDPLFGYYIEDSQNVIELLRSESGILSEVQLIEASISEWIDRGGKQWR